MLATFSALLIAMSTSFASFFVRFFVARVAIATAGVAALATISAALLVAFNSAVVPLVTALNGTWAGPWIGLAFPPVSSQCLTAVALCWAACTLYGWQKSAIKVATGVG